MGILRVFAVVILPLALIELSITLILLSGSAVLLTAAPGDERWSIFWAFSFPAHARTLVEGLMIGGLLSGLIGYFLYLRSVRRVLRAKSVGIFEFAQYPRRLRHTLLAQADITKSSGLE